MPIEKAFSSENEDEVTRSQILVASSYEAEIISHTISPSRSSHYFRSGTQPAASSSSSLVHVLIESNLHLVILLLIAITLFYSLCKGIFEIPAETRDRIDVTRPSQPSTGRVV